MLLSLRLAAQHYGPLQLGSGLGGCGALVEGWDTTIDVVIFPPFRRSVRIWWVRRLVEAALRVGSCSQADGYSAADPVCRPRAVSIVLADDETVQDLNRSYRGLDEVTDVLSFSPVHQGEYLGLGEPLVQSVVPFPILESSPDELGEIVISYPQVKRQASQAGRLVHQELALLVAHGVLHLLGYDHTEAHEEAVMKARERAALGEAVLLSGVSETEAG